jgi:hypothetical protein
VCKNDLMSWLFVGLCHVFHPLPLNSIGYLCVNLCMRLVFHFFKSSLGVSRTVARRRLFTDRLMDFRQFASLFQSMTFVLINACSSQIVFKRPAQIVLLAFGDTCVIHSPYFRPSFRRVSMPITYVQLDDLSLREVMLPGSPNEIFRLCVEDL